MGVITLDRVSKALRKEPIFTEVNATFDRGRASAIIGPNGSGKSVLFKLICGFMRPDSGEVRIAPEFIPPGSQFPSDFGVVIDRPAYHPDLSALDNLRRLAAINRVIGDAEIEAAVDSVGLQAGSKKARNFSLGMKQKLGLAQAIMEDQSVLLLDEPFNALDRESVGRVRALLVAAKQRGKTILFTSHHTEDVEIIADSVYRIEHARLERVR